MTLGFALKALQAVYSGRVDVVVMDYNATFETYGAADVAALFAQGLLADTAVVTVTVSLRVGARRVCKAARTWRHQVHLVRSGVAAAGSAHGRTIREACFYVYRSMAFFGFIVGRAM